MASGPAGPAQKGPNRHRAAALRRIGARSRIAPFTIGRGEMRFRAKSYLRFLKPGERIPGVVRYIVSAVWLGFLDADDLTDITVETYEGLSGFETADHNLSGLGPWEEGAIAQHFSGCRRILVAGAGAGREVIALARLGFDVVGFDGADDLVNAGRAHLAAAGLSATLLHARASLVPEGLGQFDGLMIGRGFYHHIPGRDRRVAFLRACARYLNENAAVLVGNFMLRSPERRGLRHTYTVANAINRLRRSRDRIEPGDVLSYGFFHRFLPDEISEELNLAGMVLVRLDRAEGAEAGMGRAIGRRRSTSNGRTG